MAPSRVVLGATPRGAPLAALLLLLALAGGARAAPSAPRGFVQRVGAGFVLDGAPFHVVGANQCVPAAGLRGATCAGAREPPAPWLLCCPCAAALRPLRGWRGRTGMYLSRGGSVLGLRPRLRCGLITARLASFGCE